MFMELLNCAAYPLFSTCLHRVGVALSLIAHVHSDNKSHSILFYYKKKKQQALLMMLCY